MKKIKIGDRLIGEGEPCFVIAEAGVNHNGDVNLAKKLIKVAKESNADAVKFQNWITEEIVTKELPKPEYQKSTTKSEESQYDMLKKLELSEKDFESLADYAKKLRIIFLSTPESKKCTDLLERLDVPAYKIGSADLTNHPHLEYVAKKNKPIILSTGMATLEEVKDAVRIINNTGNKEIVLLHCTSNYPTKLKDVNLRAMLTLKKEFNLPVGYSDHTKGIGAAIVAVLLGTLVIEKHFTLDKNLPGPDHKASVEPTELKEMIKGIRLAEKQIVSMNNLKKYLLSISNNISIEKVVVNNLKTILGSSIKKPTKSEKEMIKLSRKYIIAAIDIPKGIIITKDMLSIKRSGGGLEPKNFYRIIGKKAKRIIKKNEIIDFNMV